MKIGKDITITEKDKKVSTILHRLVSEECTKLTATAGKISTLNFQAENFHSMSEVVQEEILRDMEKVMLENGWNDWIKELKDECILSGGNE